MALFKKDQAQQQAGAARPSPRAQAQQIPPKHAEQPVRDTTHGHPGLPPKDYKAPKERR
jgi:hypothetical protein